MLDAGATILTLAVFSSGLTLHRMAVSLYCHGSCYLLMFWHQHVYTDGGPDLLTDIVMVLVSSYIHDHGQHLP